MLGSKTRVSSSLVQSDRSFYQVTDCLLVSSVGIESELFCVHCFSTH